MATASSALPKRSKERLNYFKINKGCSEVFLTSCDVPLLDAVIALIEVISCFEKLGLYSSLKVRNYISKYVHLSNYKTVN